MNSVNIGVNNTYAPHEIMPLTDEQAQALLAGLEQLKFGDIPYEYVGICGNLQTLVNNDDTDNEIVATYKFVEVYAKGWEHHSGDVAYPVPRKQGQLMWENPLRFDLINYLISILEERLYCSKP